jgi:hypothetical protein
LNHYQENNWRWAGEVGRGIVFVIFARMVAAFGRQGALAQSERVCLVVVDEDTI